MTITTFLLTNKEFFAGRNMKNKIPEHFTREIETKFIFLINCEKNLAFRGLTLSLTVKSVLLLTV